MAKRRVNTLYHLAACKARPINRDTLRVISLVKKGKKAKQKPR